MDVIKFFVKYWRSINPKDAARLRWFLVLFLVIVFISGMLKTSLLGLINEILYSDAALPLMYIWVFLGLTLALSLFTYASERSLDGLFYPIYIDLMRSFMRNFMSLPIQTVEKHGPAKYYAVFSEDLRTVYDALISLMNIFLQLATGLCCLIYLGWLSPPVLAWTVLFLAVGAFLIRTRLISAMDMLAVARKDYGHAVGYYDAIGEGIKEFKMHRERRNAFFEKLVEPGFKRMTRTNIIGHNRFAIGRAVGTVLYFLLMGTILFGSMWFFEVESHVMSGYALAVLFLLSPIEVIINNSNSVYRAKVAVEHIDEVGFDMCTRPNSDDFTKAGEPLPAWEETTLKDLTFHYGDPNEKPDPHDFVLGPMNLTIRPGEVVIIAGGNGSGKTTLAKLLAGLYYPVEGTLSYNGIPITAENRDTYRQTFSAVFVDFYLFNELLGLEHIPDLDNKARQYLNDLKIGDKLDVQDGRLSTTDLSQGQRKRLALMITFLEDRPFYIFDEWTSHQDPHFRAFFYEDILPTLKKRGKAVLVITHDDQYFLHGDRILKMDMGKLEFDVTSESLQGKNPLEIGGSV